MERWIVELRFALRRLRTRPTYTILAVLTLALALVCNTDPWTYLGSTPVRMSPETSFDTGLGVFALNKMSVYPVLRHVAEMLRGRGKPHGRNSIQAADVPHLRVTCTEPLRLQVDGDCLGERSAIEFSSVPNALRVAV